MSIRAPTGALSLFEASLRFYKALGVWPHFRGRTAPLARIAMIDATGARLPCPRFAFAARLISPAFGENIENNVLVEGLRNITSATRNLVLHEGMISDISFDADAIHAALADGHCITATLAVAADGELPRPDEGGDQAPRSWTYPQIAFTALLSHAKPHRNISTEFHTRSGPCTLVPLRAMPERPNRSSLVWLMSAGEAERRRALPQLLLEQEIEAHTNSLFGEDRDRWAGRLPMAGMSANRLSGHRVALCGEAAHIFPPLAAQGLNLSLRDGAALVEVLEDARALGAGVNGLAQTLKEHDNVRRSDVLRTNGVDILNRSLFSNFFPVEFLARCRTFSFSMIGPLRRALMREGVLTHGTLPRLMRERPLRHLHRRRTPVRQSACPGADE